MSISLTIAHQAGLFTDAENDEQAVHFDNQTFTTSYVHEIILPEPG
jgi:hypothetical protein